jgi:hypothetical protein
MVRQGSDSHAGLTLIPSCRDGLPDQRLKLGLKLLLASNKPVFIFLSRDRSTNIHAGRIGRSSQPDKEPFAVGFPGSFYG